MKASEVYRKAAERIASRMFSQGEHYCACYAITLADKESEEENKAMFSDWFMPEGKFKEQYWFGDTYDKEARKERILALCFMAAIAEDEERGKRRGSS